MPVTMRPPCHTDSLVHKKKARLESWVTNKDQADKEDTVPNGLLTFEFEGRNSMISDLSSLASYGSEQSLAIENLPDSIKRQFR